MDKKSKSLLEIERKQRKIAEIIIDCQENNLPELEEEMMADLSQLHKQHWDQYLTENRKPGDLSSCILPAALLINQDFSEQYRTEARIQVVEIHREKILCSLLELEKKEPILSDAEIELHGHLLEKYNQLFNELERLRELKYPKRK